MASSQCLNTHFQSRVIRYVRKVLCESQSLKQTEKRNKIETMKKAEENLDIILGVFFLREVRRYCTLETRQRHYLKRNNHRVGTHLGK